MSAQQRKTPVVWKNILYMYMHNTSHKVCTCTDILAVALVPEYAMNLAKSNVFLFIIGQLE